MNVVDGCKRFLGKLFPAKKTSLVAASVALLVCVGATAAWAGNPVKLLVNGHEVTCDVAPQIIDGRTMVPVRWVAEALGAEVNWDAQNNAVNISKSHFISSNPKAKARLYPFQEINGMYDGFILEVNGNRQYFNWKNISNPTFAPRIVLTDINQDDEEELIIILTTGNGTGVHIEDIHVLNPDTFTEFEVEAPAEIVKQNIVTGIAPDGDQVTIHIKIGDEETKVYKDKDYAATWFDSVSIGNNRRYEVIDNKLVAKMVAQVSPAGFIGEIEATYVFDHGRYRAESIIYNNEDNNDLSALREEYFQFGIENRLDYVPVFDEGKAPASSTEYLFWAFAVNLEKWGDEKGTMTRDYVEQVIRTHFEVDNITHAPMHKGWDYDGARYTAVPQGIKEKPIYVLREFDSYTENGRTVYRITLDNCSFGGALPTNEDMANIKASIIAGDLSALTVLQTECFQYYIDQATGDVVFVSHTLTEK
ncbi:MAG: copper amine oxidase N-terminal domain-containing protein [Syntrophomonadales bacterium]|jgi:hypothetical protein